MSMCGVEAQLLKHGKIACRELRGFVLQISGAFACRLRNAVIRLISRTKPPVSIVLGIGFLTKRSRRDDNNSHEHHDACPITELHTSTSRTHDRSGIMFWPPWQRMITSSRLLDLLSENGLSPHSL